VKKLGNSSLLMLWNRNVGVKGEGGKGGSERGYVQKGTTKKKVKRPGGRDFEAQSGELDMETHRATLGLRSEAILARQSDFRSGELKRKILRRDQEKDL